MKENWQTCSLLPLRAFVIIQVCIGISHMVRPRQSSVIHTKRLTTIYIQHCVHPTAKNIHTVASTHRRHTEHFNWVPVWPLKTDRFVCVDLDSVFLKVNVHLAPSSRLLADKNHNHLLKRLELTDSCTSRRLYHIHTKTQIKVCRNTQTKGSFGINVLAGCTCNTSLNKTSSMF